MAEALVATGVGRSYGAQRVLENFSLTLPEGGFEALMGPSGSGKSTFLHLAAGLLSADAGSITVGGENIVTMTDSQVTKFRRQHIGVVFQDFNLLNNRTIRENIALPVKLAGAKVDTARLESLATRLGIAALLDKKPESISGGERQRAAIARALFAEPEVVLADEPTGNLDTKAAHEICALLKELNATEKSAILVVTHDPVVAAAAKKVNFIDAGHIVRSFDTNGDAALVSKLYLETYQ